MPGVSVMAFKLLHAETPFASNALVGEVEHCSLSRFMRLNHLQCRLQPAVADESMRVHSTQFIVYDNCTVLSCM